MQAIILCGGFGTRLREETEFRPKPLVKIGERPILWHIMKHYRHHGVRDFVLCLGYRGTDIRDYFLNYRNHVADCHIDLASGAVTFPGDEAATDWRVSLIDTGQDTLTGSRIKKVLKHVEGERFFATYGDGVGDVDLDALLAHHDASGGLATVTAVHPSSRFGELAMDGPMAVAFNEKPQVTEGWINGGFMVFERAAFERIDPAANVALETGLLEALATDRQLAVYRHQGFWQSMDTYREMRLLNDMWEEGRRPWKTWTD